MSPGTYSANIGIGIVSVNNSGQFYIDDFVVYAGSVDNTAPNSPGSVTVNNPTTSSLDVSWGAASGGVDGGGYVVVRFASNPGANDDPNQNGIYAVGNSVAGSVTGTVRYIGTGTSFTDNVGLSAGTTYYYKVYTVDKAFNYSAESSGSGTTSSGGSSTSSDIITANNETSNIDYASYQSSSINTTSDGVRVWSFTIRDGGGSADADALGTILTAITIGKGTSNEVTSWANTIRQAALFDGSTKIAEVSVSGETISFTGMSGSNVTAADDGNKTLDLYMTFESAVTDNQQFHFKITSATADGSGSGFATANAGGDSSSVSGDNNRIEVTATKLRFVQQPTNTVSGVGMSPAVTVEAADANNNRDLDYTTNVSMTSSGTLTGSPVSVAPSSGLATFSSLTHTGNGNGIALTASSGSLTSAVSNTFNILTNSLSDIIASPEFSYPVNIGYHIYQEASDIQPTETSIEVFEVRIRDGGASADADTAGTTLSAISFNVTNYNYIRRAALYDGDTELAEVAVSGATVAFTGFSATAPDNGYKDLTVRVSFQGSVVDNQQFQFSVTSVTAASSGSGFASANGGGAQSSIAGDNNRIEVTATCLRLSEAPKYVSTIAYFTFTATAYDDNEMIDLDFESPVTLTRNTGLGVLSSVSGLTQNLAQGTKTWSDLRYSRLETGVSIRTENSGGLANDTSNTFEVVIFRETMGTVSSTTPIATHESNNGFDMDTLTYSGSADVRNTTPSSGYADASGNANIFITNVSGTNYLISNLNTASYTNMQLSFGIYKSTTASNGSELVVEVSSDGSSYTALSFPALPTGTGTAIWYYRTASGSIPSASNLRIRFRQTSTSPQFRIDDVLLRGERATTGASDIIAADNEASTIPYVSYQSSTINSTSDAVRVWSFTIRDGGGSADADALGTILTDITIGKGTSNSVTSWANTIRKAALFDGSTKVAEIHVTGETITFSGMSGSNVTAPDNSSKTLDLYLTFESAVTDNQRFHFKITGAAADASGTDFAFSDAGGAQSSVSGDMNRIAVVADRLMFSNEPSVVNVGVGFAITVSAADALGCIDVDETSGVTLVKNAGTGNLSSASGLTNNLASGTVTWNDLIWDMAEDNVRIAATHASFIPDTTQPFNVVAEKIYTWNQTGTASYTVAANWTPARSSVSNIDYLRFNSGAAVTVTNVPTETIGKIEVTNNTVVNLQAGASSNTLTINGVADEDLNVAAGSQLNVNGSNALNIFLNTNATASISGNMLFINAAHRLNAQSAGAIRLRSGSSITQGTNCTGNLFTNSGTANVAVFDSGSQLISQAGANPFGLSAPNSKVVFQTGSYYRHQQNSLPSFSGRTYANIEINNASFSQSATGSSAFIADSIIMTQGALNLNLTGGIQIKGSINVPSGNTLTFTPANPNNITFNGNGGQKIYGSGTLTYASNSTLIVDKSDTLYVERDITVEKALTLISGIIKVGSGKAITIGSAGTVSGGINTSYVEGALAKIFPVSASPQSFQFKTGSRGDIQPVTVSLATVSGSPVTITSQQINGNPLIDLPTTAINTAAIDNISGVHYWNITQSGGSFTNAQITLTYVSTPGNSDSVQLGSELRLAQLDNSDIWQLIGGVGSANWSGTITSNVFNDFQGGYFTFADPVGGADITLPVELAYFRVERSEKTGWVRLSWRTESEINNAFFLVQRRYATGDFESLAEIPGQGNKSSRTDYTFTDSAAAISDTLYYRLADISYDGIKVYHPEKMIAPSRPQSFLLQPNYPNPFNPQTTLIYGLSAADHVSIEVYNVLGQKVRTLLRLKEQSAGWYRVIWDGTNDQGSRVAAGLYFSVFRTSKGRQVQKMLLIK